MTDRTKEWVYGIIAEASFFGFLALSRNLTSGPILRGFPENHEFGLGDGHTLSFEEQIA